VQFHKVSTPNTHSWPVFRNSKESEEGALKEETSKWDMRLLLEENNVER